MRFTGVLSRNMIPEWIKLYLNFKLLESYLEVSKQLKELLILSKKTKPRQYRAIKKSILATPGLALKIENDNTRFIQTFDDEMEKVETFILWKYTDLKQKQAKLQSQVKMMKYMKEDLDTRSVALTRQWNYRTVFEYKELSCQDSQEQLKKDRTKFQENSSILMETFYRFYHESEYYKAFLELNCEAKKRIMKKYYKRTLNIHLKLFHKKDTLSYFMGKNRQMNQEIKQMMIINFYPLNAKTCTKNLQNYSEGKKSIKQHHVFIFGFFVGYITVFVMILFFMRYQGDLDPQGNTVFNKVFPCFRGMILFLTYYWFLAMDVLAYEHFKLNYRIYLNFNHHFSTGIQIVKRVSILSTIYLIIFVVYIMQQEDVSRILDSIKIFNPRYLPIIPWIIGAVYVLIPTRKSLNGQGRMWMYRMAWGALFGHYWKTEPRFGFFADQISSMVTPFKDLNYTACYYYFDFQYSKEPDHQCDNSNRVSSLVPFVIPQIMIMLMFLTKAKENGKFWGSDQMWSFFKILLSLQVGILAFLANKHELARQIWIPVAVCSSLWMYHWDITKDWMFFQPNARHKFLRDDLGYNYPWIYYSLAVLNLFLRATWALSISPNIYLYLGIKSEFFGLLVGFLEMTRRLISNFMRIEREHILNQNNLKTVVDYKYPFEQRALSATVILEETKLCLALQSLLYRIIVYLTQINLASQINIVLQVSNRKVPDRDSLNVMNKKETSSNHKIRNSSFKISDIVPQKIIRSDSGYSGLEGKSVNMDIITKAKKQEKYQITMIQKIEKENLQFEMVLEQLKFENITGNKELFSSSVIIM